MTEAVIIYFYMITASVMKELNIFVKIIIVAIIWF